MNVSAIHPFSLILLGLLIPAGMITAHLLKLHLNKDIVISHTRMILQLTAVGFFLEWLFTFEGTVPGLLWFTVMTATASFAILRSSRLRLRLLLGPVGITVGLIAFLHLYLFLLAAGPDVWNAQGIVPIGGMLLGNTMGSIIIGLSEFFSGMHSRVELYDFRRSLGHSQLRAALPFIRTGLRRSLAPQLATIATIGIVSLPGMMTGQILGGSPPLTAVTYQIAIMIAVFSTRLVGTAAVILTALHFSTTPLGNLRPIFRADAA
ncbi:MAG: ABC transporter permease [Spirochaeta sp.]